MIDSRKLRAGNRVFHNTSSSTVTVLKVENDKILLDTFPKSSYFLNTEISGIPVTAAMLYELSFTNDDEVDTYSGHGISIHLKPDGFFYGLRIAKSRAKIEYLHELQNYLSDFYLTFKQETRSLNLSPLYS
ncbi:MAG: hypothetical protein ABJB05_02610 [Parafilimonas sp.]